MTHNANEYWLDYGFLKDVTNIMWQKKLQLKHIDDYWYYCKKHDLNKTIKSIYGNLTTH